MPKILSLIAVLIALASCVKVTEPPNNTGGKSNAPDIQMGLVAVGGSDQTGAVGKELIDSIVVKINEPGSAANNLQVRIFQKTLCNGDSVIERNVMNGTQLSYKWRLSNEPGEQTLSFKVLNNNQKIVDSIKVTATAVAPQSGWHASGCALPNGSILSFAMTNIGRIYATYGWRGVQYTDDNGISWHTFVIPEILNAHVSADKMLITKKGEMYVPSLNNNIYYSKDGEKWENIWINSSIVEWNRDMVELPDGRILYASTNGGVYLSNGYGQAFVPIVKPSDGLNLYEFSYQAMLTNGDIYFRSVLNFVPKIIRLNHLTSKFEDVTNLPVEDVNTFYIDDNGTWYAGGRNSVKKTAELYKSSDQGATWGMIFSAPNTSDFRNDAVCNFSKQADGKYYFLVKTQFYRSADLQTFEKINMTVNSYQKYIVSRNGNLIINSYPETIQFLVP